MKFVSWVCYLHLEKSLGFVPWICFPGLLPFRKLMYGFWQLRVVSGNYDIDVWFLGITCMNFMKIMNIEKLCGFGNMEFRQFLIRLIMTFLGHCDRLRTLLL